MFVTAPPKKKKKPLIEEIDIKQEVKTEGEELGGKNSDCIKVNILLGRVGPYFKESPNFPH